MKKCPQCGTQNDDDANFCTNCNTAFRSRDTVGSINTELPADMRPKEEQRLLLEPGEVFAGRYEIIEQIGQGGMGIVYKSRETLGTSVERNIALKLIRSELLVNEAATDKLVHEGVLTQKIRHKNVVAVHNVGVFEDQPFVAMEFVDGISMREWLRRKFNFRNDDGLKVDIPFPVAARIVKELLSGLEAAHELGIVHRDLKPENVIFTGEPGADAAPLQILDFGIARAPGPAVTTGSGPIGSFEYMAQEQKTNPQGAGPAADLYSISVIFYEMLMEVLPRNEGRDLGGTRGDVPAGVAALISKGLANAPRGRPQSVAEYRSVLEGAEPPSGKTPDRKQQKRAEPKDIEKGKNIPPPPAPSQIPKPVVIAGGAGAALVALIGLGSLLPEPNGGGGSGGGGSSTSGSLSTSGGGGPVYEGYEYLGGTWYDDTGEGSNVYVAPDGSFETSDVDDAGNPITLSGNLPQQTYTLTNQYGSVAANMQWDGGCHINLSAPDANGVIVSMQLHLDHTPDSKVCPEKFKR